MNIKLVDAGIENGVQLWEVLDADTGEHIGWNRNPIEVQ